MFYQFIPFIIIALFDAGMFFALWFISQYYNGNVVFNFGDHKFDVAEADFWKTALITYPVSSALQQAAILLLYYLFLKILPLQYTLVVVCILFGFLHFPNLVLFFATTALEFVLLTLFSVSNIFFYAAMVFTHALLATCLLKFFKADMTRNFRVWIDFFQNKGGLQ